MQYDLQNARAAPEWIVLFRFLWEHTHPSVTLTLQL